MFEERFENMIRQYDQALSERMIFVGLIRDLFPEDNMKANLIIDAYDLGIAEEIQKASEIDKAFAHRFIRLLEKDHGISKNNAEWAISTWCVCYGKNILAKECSVAISPITAEATGASLGGKQTKNPSLRNPTSSRKGILPVTIGMEANGAEVVRDFAVIPHILVCGFSGTGKTSFVQAVLATLAREHSHNEIGYLIYDSKTTDYPQFKHLPHMVGPVIYDQKQFLLALEWVKSVNQKRYSLFADKKVNNLDAYNNKSGDQLPHLFIVIDDLYALLFNAEKDSVDCLKYLLMNGRQTGIHFIIVTSTPSTKVLQTDIMFNLPCRICFAVANKADSRTILGFNGAEELAVPGEIILKTQNQFVNCRAIYMPEEDILDTIIAFRRPVVNPDTTILSP